MKTTQAADYEQTPGVCVTSIYDGAGEPLTAGGKSHAATEDTQGVMSVYLTFDLSSECLHVHLKHGGWRVSDNVSISCSFKVKISWMILIIVKCEAFVGLALWVQADWPS